MIHQAFSNSKHSQRSILHPLIIFDGMISRNSIRLPGTKINNPLPWCVMALMLLCNVARSQSPGAAYDTVRKEIVLLFNGDSTAVISLDKTFEVGFNHEKKRKKKTVRYRLARYGKADSIEQIPVYLANRNTEVHLRGKLHGDTVVPFTLEIRTEGNALLMEMRVKDISVNEFSFTLRMLKPLNLEVGSGVPDTVLKSRNRKRKGNRISLFGHGYIVRFQGSLRNKI